jgi:pimeloyl-ACP methyl ester carboxylesterase
MRERAFSFGDDGILVGILTEPEQPRFGAPAVLLANAGLNHHVGPFRAWVDLARRLAGHGFTTLRFDRAGIGDSEPRDGGSGTNVDRSILDYRDAFRLLESKRQVKEFIVVGLCSGVDPIHRLARDDDRVVAAAFIDGYSYQTPRFHLRRALRFTQPGRWRRWLAKRRMPSRSTVAERPEIFDRAYPEREAMRADVDEMLRHDKQLLFVYTAGFDVWFNHRRQFFDMLDSSFAGRPLEVVYHPAADHTFSIMEHRQWLEDKLATWMLSL